MKDKEKAAKKWFLENQLGYIKTCMKASKEIEYTLRSQLLEFDPTGKKHPSLWNRLREFAKKREQEDTISKQRCYEIQQKLDKLNNE